MAGQKKVSSDTKLMAALIASAPGGGTIFALFAGGIRNLLGQKVDRRCRLQQDETYQDNVNFIRKVAGPHVKISHDMPPIHETCGLVIGDTGIVADLDAAMKATMLSAVRAVQAKQSEQGGFINWKQLQKIFDDDGAGMFHPCVEKDSMKYDSRMEQSGVYCKFNTEPNMQAAVEAEKMMKNVVGSSAIWDALQIDTDVVKNVFSAEGVPVRWLEPLTALARSANFAHIAIDVGVVRFPRIDDPFFKLYRLRVMVFRSEVALLFMNKKGTGIFCQFEERTYDMTQRFSDKFTPAINKKVNEKFEGAMEALGIMI